MMTEIAPPVQFLVLQANRRYCANPEQQTERQHADFISGETQHIAVCQTAIVRVFGDKPILGTVALLESVKRSLHLLQLVAGDVADHCLEIKMVTYFQLIDETSLRTLARQCRRQQLASCCPEPAG